MLNLKNRIRLSNDFKNTLKSGESFFCKNLLIKTTKNTLKLSRFGIIVSTKVSKKAVERNRLKRIIRSILEKNLNEVKAGQDVVIVLNSSIINKERVEISDTLLQGFNRLKLINYFKK